MSGTRLNSTSNVSVTFVYFSIYIIHLLEEAYKMLPYSNARNVVKYVCFVNIIIKRHSESFSMLLLMLLVVQNQNIFTIIINSEISQYRLIQI